VRSEAQGMFEALKTKVQPTSRGVLNPTLVGKDRAFEWTRVDLDDVKIVKNRLGGKINDVILALVAGAVRRHLAAHGSSAKELLDFRVIVPFDTRALGGMEGDFGNRVVPTLARLPLELETPRARYEAIRHSTRAIKASGQVKGLMRLEDLANLAVVAPLAAILRATTRYWAGNLIVTNVPGPPMPHYFLGARMLACYPIVPILGNQALGIALFSYAGGLYFGFHADREAVPDLRDLVRSIPEELAALVREAPAA
jgi:WS/DGAT/MGAT family acyltransferase